VLRGREGEKRRNWQYGHVPQVTEIGKSRRNRKEREGEKRAEGATQHFNSIEDLARKNVRALRERDNCRKLIKRVCRDLVPPNSTPYLLSWGSPGGRIVDLLKKSDLWGGGGEGRGGGEDFRPVVLRAPVGRGENNF